MSVYREGQSDVERKVEALEARVKTLEIKDAPSFRERWRARAEWARDMGVPVFFVGTFAIAATVFVVTLRSCSSDAEAARVVATERCAAVCEAIGMHGSALDVGEDGYPAHTACYCGLGTRLVSIRHDGTVTGIDTTTGAVFPSAETP